MALPHRPSRNRKSLIRTLLATALASTALLSITAAAHAADVIVDVPEPVLPVVVEPFSFTGAYVGIQGGYAFADIDSDDLNAAAVTAFGAGTRFDLEADGYVVGAHAGFNAQFGNFIGGVYADIDYANLDIELDGSAPGLGTFNDDLAEVDGFIARGLLKGGVAFNRVMAYAQGGVAYANLDLGDVNPAVNAGAINAGVNLNNLDAEIDSFGFAVGGGVDVAVTDRILVGADYLYHQFSDFDVDVNNTSFETDADLDLHTIRAKVSFKF